MAMKQGAYILPTTFTMFNLGLGFFAIVQSIQGNVGAAALAIVIGHVADVLDGIGARLTKTTSSFGLEFDSFADIVTFGIAPAILMYQFVLYNLGKWGFVFALFFVLCSAFRLAKFNIRAVQIQSDPDADDANGHFVGLPTPAAGGILAAIVLVSTMPEVRKSIPLVMHIVPLLVHIIPVVMFILSWLMISRIQFVSSKKMKLFRPHSMRSIVIWVLGGLLMYLYPQNLTFILYMTYIIWGLTMYVWRGYRLKRRNVNAAE
jgi:CDP-diacylglycerol---serine O-phosphatidyltransferase